MDAPVTRIYEFAEWRLDAPEHLLLRRGEPVPLTPKVFETLVVLVENAGRLVPKDEFMKRVWPDAFVEEAALAQNISVLRKTLSVDDAHLIETVPKLGYRFLAKVQVVPDTADGGAEAAVQENVADKTGRTRTRLQKIAIALAGVALLVIANIALQWIAQPSEPKVLRSTALTSSGRVDPGGGITIDGSRVYFLERQGARFRLMQTSVAGGEPSPAPAPFPNTRIFGLSPDGSQFLIGDFADLADAMPLSTMPAQGGAPHRIGDVMANDAAWFPDGKRILYSHDRGVFSVEADGRNARHLFDVNGLARISPGARMAALSASRSSTVKGMTRSGKPQLERRAHIRCCQVGANLLPNAVDRGCPMDGTMYFPPLEWGGGSLGAPRARRHSVASKECSRSPHQWARWSKPAGPG